MLLQVLYRLFLGSHSEKGNSVNLLRMSGELRGSDLILAVYKEQPRTQIWFPPLILLLNVSVMSICEV